MFFGARDTERTTPTTCMQSPVHGWGRKAHKVLICHLHMITQGWKGMHSGVVVVVHSKLNNYDAVTSAVRETFNYGSMAGPLAAHESK